MGDHDYTKDQLREIDTDIERLYYAARHAIPDAANRISGAATRLAANLETLNVQSALAGDPAFLRTMLGLGEDIFHELRVGVVSADHFATSLEATADDFRTTDDQAATDANGIARFIQKMPDPKMAPIPDKLKDRLGDPGATDHQPFTGPIPPGATRPDVTVHVDPTGGPFASVDPAHGAVGSPDAELEKMDQQEEDRKFTHNQQEHHGG